MKHDQLLKQLAFRQWVKGPLVLAILDGVGLGKPDDSNAVHLAKTPFLDSIFKSPFYTTLKAHGTAVGMPSDEDMGNSEVGHNVLGAGRVFAQGAKLVQEAVESGALFKEQTWQDLLAFSSKNTLHLMGLLSDGNVHAHIRHWEALIKEAAKTGQKKLRLHILLDGRDVDGRSALNYVEQIESVLLQINQQAGFDYQIASGGGRMLITMDRYGADWPMVKRGWDTHVLGRGLLFNSATEAIKEAYQDPNLNDQFTPPFVIGENRANGSIEDGDGVVFVNFRGDRALEMCEAFETENFRHFERIRVPKVFFCGMMQYDADTKSPIKYLVHPPKFSDPISYYMASEKLKSMAISETQKYGHVTYFWNGNASGYVDESLETYIEIPSDAQPFDANPAMKAVEITDKTLEFMNQNPDVDFIRINYPNGDMIGHTGNMKAVIESLEAVDSCMKRLAEAVFEKEGVLVLLADHGNADIMWKIDKNGNKVPVTSHTLNPVPFKICFPSNSELAAYVEMAQLEEPGLANVAATLLMLLGFEPPAHFENALIKHSFKK